MVNNSKNAHAIMGLILDISNDRTINDSERSEKVKNLAESYFETTNPDLLGYLGRLETNLENYNLDINFNQYLFNSSEALQKSYSPIIKLLTFDRQNSDTSLLEAIDNFKDKNFKITDDTPTDFLSKKDIQVIFLHENIVPVISRYKVKLFLEIEKAIRNKKLTLDNSYRYRATHSYMISNKEWLYNSNELIRAAGLEAYKDGNIVINQIGKKLTRRYTEVNERCEQNEYISFDSHGKWKLKTAEADFDSTKYIPNLLGDRKSVPLYELLAEIDENTQFTDFFKHYLNRHANTAVQKKLLFATLISLGTNLGHTVLSKASKDISEKQLRDTEKNWFSENSLSKINQIIVKLIRNLPLPTLYSNNDNLLHSSSDGKKIVVAVNSLLANYSYKYYGKEQGITVNSFLDEKQAFFHVNILTSSDREAPYMMDGLVKSHAGFREINPKEMDDKLKKRTHSTDSHGYTEAIFAGLHFLDVSFAPRIAKLEKQTLYAFEEKSLKSNSHFKIAPKSKIKRNLILDNWDDILRLMVTIKLNKVSASLMFKMLSASASDSPLYKALKEFGKLLKSLFILNYIDDVDLRRSITKQLNRVELGQKLAGAVFYGRKGRLQVGTANEMQIAMLCKSILQNSIILWNYMFLSDYYKSLSTLAEKRSASEMISKGSVIAWHHINMMGIFDFDHEKPTSFRATFNEMMKIKVVQLDTSS